MPFLKCWGVSIQGGNKLNILDIYLDTAERKLKELTE
jgi:hypothetical protein